MANQKKTPAASTQKKKSAAPQKGNGGNNRTAKPSPAAGKKTAKAAPKSAPAAPVREKKPPNPDRILHQVIPYILAVAALFLLICFILTDAVRLEQPMGVVGHWLHSLLCGLWSWGAFYIPLLLVYFAIVWRRSVGDGTLGYKLLFAFLCLTFCSALVETFAIRAIGGEVPGINPVTLWQAGCALQGGGVIGGLVGNLCFRGFGFVGTLIVVIALLLVFIMLLFGLTPSAIVLYVRYWIKVREEKKREQENRTPIFINRPRFPEPVPAAEPQPVPEKPGKRRKKFDVDVPINSTGKIEDIDLPIPDLPEAPLPDDGDVPEENPIDPAIFDEVMAETRSEQPAVQDDPFVGDVTAIATEGVEGREKIKPTRGKSSARQL
ncbi:MAG: DNA translocase FtsK 4TM domain-containing protein, partial [Clostridia bacterium]|nr:DNA translocase FtsK 4TM domain-containing protein [Clostridia bacterium]